MAIKEITISAEKDINDYLYCEKLWELEFKKTVDLYKSKLGDDYEKIAELVGTTREAIEKLLSEDGND